MRKPCTCWRARSSKHQIKIDVANGGEADLDGASRLGAVVDATQRLQMRIVETLDADRQTRHSGVTKTGELLHFKSTRVRLQRDLGLGRKPRPCPHPGQDVGNAVRREQARRATADEHRMNRAAPEFGQLHFQIQHQRVDVLALRNTDGAVRTLVRIEVAIRALAHAPRDVDVERQRRQRGEVRAEHG